MNLTYSRGTVAIAWSVALALCCSSAVQAIGLQDMGDTASSAEEAYKAGHRHLQWHDDARDRPVWVDIWYPAEESAEESQVIYGLGHGTGAQDAGIAAQEMPFPLIVMSHGAFGSARDYGWIAEYLARRGFIILGVSHYGESWIYGPDSVDPSAVTRLWTRPLDCTFALDLMLSHADFTGKIDQDRIGALGHSSGGATAVALGGAIFDPNALGIYCQSEAATDDRGCQYAKELQNLPPAGPEATASYRDLRVKTLVMMDPAVGPGYTEATLASVQLPALIIGSEKNDFLPFDHHAGRYARLLPHASFIALNRGEGHFVYLSVCTSDLSANGVPLCQDREGVDRQAVHQTLAPQIVDFLGAHLKHSKGETDGR